MLAERRAPAARRRRWTRCGSHASLRRSALLDGGPTSREHPDQVVKRLRDAHALSTLVGDAPAFASVLARLPALARGDVTVLISGETGTGKELVARAIHYLGSSASLPFIPLNCGSLPDALFEDEMFGHARGAYTDAREERAGLIANAEGGTLFLDEVECLPMRAQAALLRLLQDKTYRALGSNREQRASVRFIAATNRPLRALVAAGEFRSDLYYRLCVLTIELPPLRARRGDVLRLAAHFLRKHAFDAEYVQTLSPAAERALLAYEWPGNVRELENTILRGIHSAPDDVIDEHDLGIPLAGPDDIALPDLRVPTSFQDAKRQTIEAFERDFLTRLMQEHGGNVSRAAISAGKERRELGKLLKKYRLAPDRFARRDPRQMRA